MRARPRGVSGSGFLSIACIFILSVRLEEARLSSRCSERTIRLRSKEFASQKRLNSRYAPPAFDKGHLALARAKWQKGANCNFRRLRHVRDRAFRRRFFAATEENWRQRVEAASRAGPRKSWSPGLTTVSTFSRFTPAPPENPAPSAPKMNGLSPPAWIIPKPRRPTPPLSPISKRRQWLAHRLRRFGRRLRFRPEGRRPRRALNSVHLDAGLALVFDLPSNAEPFVAAWLDLVAARGYDAKKIDVSFGLDPIGAALRAARSWTGRKPGQSWRNRPRCCCPKDSIGALWRRMAASSMRPVVRLRRNWPSHWPAALPLFAHWKRAASASTSRVK